MVYTGSIWKTLRVINLYTCELWQVDWGSDSLVIVVHGWKLRSKVELLTCLVHPTIYAPTYNHQSSTSGDCTVTWQQWRCHRWVLVYLRCGDRHGAISICGWSGGSIVMCKMWKAWACFRLLSTFNPLALSSSNPRTLTPMTQTRMSLWPLHLAATYQQLKILVLVEYYGAESQRLRTSWDDRLEWHHHDTGTHFGCATRKVDLDKGPRFFNVSDSESKRCWINFLLRRW